MIFRLVILVALCIAGLSNEALCMKPSRGDNIVRKKKTGKKQKTTRRRSKDSKKKSRKGIRKRSDQGPQREKRGGFKKRGSLPSESYFWSNQRVRRRGNLSDRDSVATKYPGFASSSGSQIVGPTISNEQDALGENFKRLSISPRHWGVINVSDRFLRKKAKDKGQKTSKKSRSRILTPRKRAGCNRIGPSSNGNLQEEKPEIAEGDATCSIIKSISMSPQEALNRDHGSDLVELLTNRGANSLLKNRDRFMPKNVNLIWGDINVEVKKWFEKAVDQGKVNCLLSLAEAFPEQCDFTQILLVIISAKNELALKRLLKSRLDLIQEKYLIRSATKKRKEIRGTLFDLLVYKQQFEWCDVVCSKFKVPVEFDMKRLSTDYNNHHFKRAREAFRGGAPSIPRLKLSDVSSCSTDSMDMVDRGDSKKRVCEEDRSNASVYNPVLSGTRTQSLHELFKAGKLSRLKKIVKLGADYGEHDLFYEQDSVGNTPLHYLFLNMISAESTKKFCSYFTIYAALLEAFSFDGDKLEALNNKVATSCFTITGAKGNTFLHRLAYLFAHEKDIVKCKELVNVILSLTGNKKMFKRLILSENKEQQKPIDIFLSGIQKGDPLDAYKKMIAKNSFMIQQKK